MTDEERGFLSEQFQALKEKIDDVVDPVKSDVGELKRTVSDHQIKLTQFESFKEGHQNFHKDLDTKKRFNWEMVASSGVIAVIFGLLIAYFQKG